MQVERQTHGGQKRDVSAGGRIQLLKCRHTVGAKVFCNPSQAPNGIVLIHLHEAADDSVESLREPSYFKQSVKDPQVRPAEPEPPEGVYSLAFRTSRLD